MTDTVHIHDSKENACDMFKYSYSTVLLVFSTILVMGLIFTEQTTLSKDVHPALAFVVIWAALIWLNMVEGGQASLVGLPPIDRELYKESHPTANKICSLAHKGDNLDRYLMGRQFMVLAIVFVVNLSGAPLPYSSLWGLPSWIISIFLGSGVAMILMTAMAGQLNSQVNASHCMLDYINNAFATFTLYVALGIEFSGLLHVCYLFQLLFGMAAGKPIESFEEPRTTGWNIFYWARVVMSLVILCFCYAVTLAALFNGQTTMWDGVPPAVAVILFFLLMGVVGMLEGMQIAFFAVAKLPKEEQAHHPMAMKTCNLLFKGEGRNLPGFMVGRQVCVTLCFFVIARVTTLSVEIGVDENIFGVSDGLQEFFNTGLLGAIITTVCASITWQLIASAFPVAFLSNPLVYILLRICLFLESTGICAGAWVLAKIHKKIAGFQYDEVYVGTPEERAARAKQTGTTHADEEQKNVVPGHLYPGVPTLPPGFGPPVHTIKEITEMQAQLHQHMRKLEARQRDLELQRQKILRIELERVESQRESLKSQVNPDYDDELALAEADPTENEEDPYALTKVDSAAEA